MNNPEFISYTDEEGLRLLFHSPGTKILGDETYQCPDCGDGSLSPRHRKALRSYVEKARRNTSEQEGRS